MNWIEKGILPKHFGDILHNLIFHQPCKIQRIDAGNVILFQIKVYGRNIK